MRMDDCLPAASVPDEEASAAASEPRRSSNGLRFTSNVVGSLFLFTDIVCFVIAEPTTVGVYSLVRGWGLEVPVHFTDFILILGSLLLVWFVLTAVRRNLIHHL